MEKIDNGLVTLEFDSETGGLWLWRLCAIARAAQLIAVLLQLVTRPHLQDSVSMLCALHRSCRRRPADASHCQRCFGPPVHWLCLVQLQHGCGAALGRLHLPVGRGRGRWQGLGMLQCGAGRGFGRQTGLVAFGLLHQALQQGVPHSSLPVHEA